MDDQLGGGQEAPRTATPDERPRGRVVVGVDGSTGARAALVSAIREAAGRGAELDVVIACRVALPWAMGAPVVVPDVDDVLEDARSRARAEIEEARTDPALTPVPGGDGVQARVLAVEGAPAQAMVDETEGAELLVVGSRGRGPVRSALLGSVALHCITHARCPVLVVHGSVGAPPPSAPVVAGLDGSPESLAACRLAVEEATRWGVDVDVVAAYSVADYWTDMGSVVVPSPPEIRALVQQRAEQLTARLRRAVPLDPGVRTPEVRVHAVEGAAQDVLVQRSRTASLVVVGSRGRGAIRGLLLGSVALHVAMHAVAPVAVAHGLVAVAEEAGEETVEVTGADSSARTPG